MNNSNAMRIINTCKGRDRITVRTPNGSTVTGRVCAALIFRGSHVVIDVGNGRPMVANESNIIKHEPA
jgi:hypothetical protein